MKYLAVFLFLASCGDDAASPSLTYQHDFGTQTLAAGQEHNALCQSWTLGNATDLWVNAVTLDTGGGYHHSNWFFVHDNVFDGPDGAWECDSRGFNEVAAAISGGVLYAQSTQVRHEVQQFPPGVAVMVPAHSRIVGSTHLLNASPMPVTTDLH